ncbi:MAG: hypothetical protein R2688_07595 [Fimbriimonadaceae bacterium]
MTIRPIAWLLSSACLDTCGVREKNSAVPTPENVAKTEVVGKYHLDVDDEAAAEAGGKDALPTLYINGDGRWSITIDEEKTGGTYSFGAGKVTLVDEADASKQTLLSVRGNQAHRGYRRSPLVWVKLGVQDQEEQNEITRSDCQTNATGVGDFLRAVEALPEDSAIGLRVHRHDQDWISSKKSPLPRSFIGCWSPKTGRRPQKNMHG